MGGDPVALGVLVERHSWEIWRQPSTGAEEYRDPLTSPESGTTVTLSLSPGMGSLADSTLTTDGDGRASTTYTPLSSGTDTVEAICEDSSATFTFDVSTLSEPQEEFAYSHTEATLVAELLPAENGNELAEGETRGLSLTVTYVTWDVYLGNQGSTRLENETSAPAEGASVSWSAESGDGSVSGYELTDASGFAQGSLTMGSSGTVVRVDIAYATGEATSAHLEFFPASATGDPGDPSGGSPGNYDTWLRSETLLSLVNLSADGSTHLAPGATRQITGQVLAESWDVWSDGVSEELRFNYAGPAEGITVWPNLSSGDGSLSASPLSTDPLGWFSVDFTLGSSPSLLQFFLGDGTDPAASIDFTLDDSGSGGSGDSGTGETWNYLHSEGRYHFHDLQVDGPTYELAPGETRTVSGRLSWLSWDLWGDDQGNTRMENTQLSAATGIAFGASVSQGDGSIDNLSPATDETGAFSTVFTMGSENARLSFSAEGAEEASIDFTAATPVAPVEIHLRNEKALSVSFEPQGDPASFVNGATVPVRVQVLLNEWEVWQEVDGSIVTRNHQTGPALGALVTLGLASGDGMWQSGGGSTDADGVVEAGFALGTQASHLTATVSFQGVSGEGGYVFAPEPWEFQESHDTIDLTLETTGDPATGLLATVQHRTWETWRHAVSGEIQTRAESLVPAQGAVVAFTTVGGAVTVFSQASAETGLDGTATTLYASEGPVTLAALASFAGHEALVTISAPQGFGEFDPNNPGNTGPQPGNGPENGTNPNNGPENGGTNPTNPESNPTPTTPTVKLISRLHFITLDDGITGGTAFYTMKQFFRAHLAKYDTDENGEQITVDEDVVEGERNSEVEILLPLYLEGWYLTHIEYFEREVLDFSQDGNDGSGDLNLSGYRAPGDGIDILEVLAEATHLETIDHYLPSDANQALQGSFLSNLWDEEGRTEYGLRQGDEPWTTSVSEYVMNEKHPEAYWTQYWLQAEQDVSKDAGSPSRSWLIRATRRDESFHRVGEWFGTVTFKVEEEHMVSTTRPVVSGLEDTPAASWVQASDDGTLLVRPEVVRGEVNEVNLLPVDLILDNENKAYDPNTEALGVSNFVTTNGLTGDSQFDATCDDPENFRLQARLLDDKKNTVDVKLEVVRDGATVLTKNYTLDKKDGDIVRGEFLRLVSDDVDDAASGGKKDSDPKDQTILVKLGDTIKVSYVLQGDERVEQEIDIGRPASEDNNDASHKKHDTRKVKVRFTVFDLRASNDTPSLPKPKLKSLVEKANAAFAQSGIIVEDVSSDETYGIEPPEEFNEEPIDPEKPNVTNYFSHALGVDLDSPDHQALIPYLDDDPNTIDVFIVKRLGYQSMPVQIDPFSPPIPGQFHHGNATAVPASLGQGKQKNFIIMSATQLQLADFPFRLPHEIMHILLDSGHRVKQGQNMPFGQHPPPLDPATSLFYPTTSPKNEVDGTKRIGPNPEAEAAVGNDDTKNIRKNAEKLSQ